MKEYKVVRADPDPADMQNAMNKAAQDGGEVVTVTRIYNNQLLITFVREKTT